MEIPLLDLNSLSYGTYLRHRILASRDKKGHVPACIENFHFLKSLVKSNESEYFLVSALVLLDRNKSLYAYLAIKPNSEQSEDGKPRISLGSPGCRTNRHY
jgi:hypothetical protein